MGPEISHGVHKLPRHPGFIKKENPVIKKYNGKSPFSNSNEHCGGKNSGVHKLTQTPDYKKIYK